MKLMKKILFVFFTVNLMFLGFLSACASNRQDTFTQPAAADKKSDLSEKNAVLKLETKDYLPDTEHVKPLGRTLFIDDMLLMGYSCTGAEFKVKAKHLDITIAGDNKANMPADNGSAARIAVFVDGERKLDEMILSQSQTFTIFDGVETVSGVVRVIKLSEATSSLAAISKITTDKDGVIFPAEERKLKLEFIGDSITCGYGVDDPDRNHHFRTSTEDGSKTYAYKTAANLDADYSMVSISGWGIVSGYSGDGKKQANSQLPRYYDRLAVSWSTIAGVDPKVVRWDFNSFTPDIVVINLGTNDSSYTKKDNAKITEYREAYIEFLKDVRAKNEKAYIICSLGMMGQDLCAAVKEAVTEYSSLTGDTRICDLKFANQSISDGIVADWHPSEKTHEKAAALLTAKIKEIMK